jgi:integrase
MNAWKWIREKVAVVFRRVFRRRGRADMAGFQLFRVGAVWHYRFRVGGKRVQRSTGERSRGKAEEIAFKAYSRERVVKDGGGPVPTLSRLAETWLSVHAPTASPGHVRAVKTFQQIHLYDLGKMRIDRIRTEHVELARGIHLKDHSPASANHWLRNLKLLFHWAFKRDVIGRIPWRVKMLKLQKRPRSILPVAKTEEWLAAVDTAAGKRSAIPTAVRLMLALGLRESEALSARWEWVDWDRQTYTPGITKGREAESLPMPGWLADHLAPARKPAGLVVASTHGGAYRAGATRRAIAKANVACGTPGITPHRLRGTFATLLSEAGVPVQDIQKVLRHKDPVTTMGYLELDVSRAREAQKKIAGRMGLARA